MAASLDRLVAAGIRGLYQMAVQDFGFVPQRSAYMNHCDLCHEIRCALIQAHAGRFRELALAGHYSFTGKAVGDRPADAPG